MKSKSVYIIAIVLGLAGMVLSGYLSWYTLWGPGCTETIITCGGAEPILIFGLPTCVYGFVMYLAVTVLALIGLGKPSATAIMKTVLVIAVVGVAFSGFLSYYEIFVQETALDSLPACVYGLFLYILLLIFVIVGLRSTGRREDGIMSQPPTQ